MPQDILPSVPLRKREPVPAFCSEFASLGLRSPVADLASGQLAPLQRRTDASHLNCLVLIRTQRVRAEAALQMQRLVHGWSTHVFPQPLWQGPCHMPGHWAGVQDREAVGDDAASAPVLRPSWPGKSLKGPYRFLFLPQLGRQVQCLWTEDAGWLARVRWKLPAQSRPRFLACPPSLSRLVTFQQLVNLNPTLPLRPLQSTQQAATSHPQVPCASGSSGVLHRSPLRAWPP